MTLPSGTSRSLSQAGEGAEDFAVDADAKGQRLDHWLAARLAPRFSRSRVQSLVREGRVRIDGRVELSPNRRLAAGEAVGVDPPAAEDAEPLPEAIPLDVLFEDRAVIVVNKPAGLVVHPGAGNPTGTLVNALLHHCGDSLSGIGGVKRPGIVHRLDKDTSGVMVAAKTDAAHRALSEAFADHGRTGNLERAYLALAWGTPERERGTVDAPLGRDRREPTRRAVVAAGQGDARHAVTHFVVRERFALASGENIASLLECRLETGRTHQIRVHLAHVGLPLIGDREYGRGFRTKAKRLPDRARERAEMFPRQALHAWLLAFRHPTTGEQLRFEAPLPADMTGLAQALRALE
jgi:23S rRNA pseudouridine1911/1915/1917 synthase